MRKTRREGGGEFPGSDSTIAYLATLLCCTVYGTVVVQQAADGWVVEVEGGGGKGASLYPS